MKKNLQFPQMLGGTLSITVPCSPNIAGDASPAALTPMTVTTNSFHVHLRMQCIIDCRLELQVVITSYSTLKAHYTGGLKNVVTWAQLTRPHFLNFFLIVFRQYTVTIEFLARSTIDDSIG